jgi:hypothetical protein
MPFYDFKNTQTGEVRENQMMSVSAMEKFLEDNPDWVIQLTGSIPIGDPVRMGMKKPDDGFRDLLKHMKNHRLNNRKGSTLNTF